MSSPLISENYIFVPIILYIAKSNYDLQKLNSDIEALYSEMMVLRSKVTILEQKLSDMGDFVSRIRVLGLAEAWIWNIGKIMMVL